MNKIKIWTSKYNDQTYAWVEFPNASPPRDVLDVVEKYGLKQHKNPKRWYGVVDNASYEGLEKYIKSLNKPESEESHYVQDEEEIDDPFTNIDNIEYNIKKAPPKPPHTGVQSVELDTYLPIETAMNFVAQLEQRKTDIRPLTQILGDVDQVYQFMKKKLRLK